MGWHEVAAKEGFYACTGWSIEDVIAQAEDYGFIMTEKQAVDFLKKYGDDIVEAMVDAGWFVMNNLFGDIYGK
jgi:hypothetical protein